MFMFKEKGKYHITNMFSIDHLQYRKRYFDDERRNNVFHKQKNTNIPYDYLKRKDKSYEKEKLNHLSKQLESYKNKLNYEINIKDQLLQQLDKEQEKNRLLTHKMEKIRHLFIVN